MPVTPTTKLLKSPSGEIIQSLGIIYMLPMIIQNTKVHLNFYIFDLIEFDLLIGQPIDKLLLEGHKGNLTIHLGKDFIHPLSISHSLKTETEPCLEPDPIEKVNSASIEHLIKDQLEDDVEFFLEEEDEPFIGLEPLDNVAEPP